MHFRTEKAYGRGLAGGAFRGRYTKLSPMVLFLLFFVPFSSVELNASPKELYYVWDKNRGYCMVFSSKLACMRIIKIRKQTHTPSTTSSPLRRELWPCGLIRHVKIDGLDRKSEGSRPVANSFF